MGANSGILLPKLTFHFLSKCCKWPLGNFCGCLLVLLYASPCGRRFFEGDAWSPSVGLVGPTVRQVAAPADFRDRPCEKTSLTMEKSLSSDSHRFQHNFSISSFSVLHPFARPAVRLGKLSLLAIFCACFHSLGFKHFSWVLERAVDVRFGSRLQKSNNCRNLNRDVAKTLLRASLSWDHFCKTLDL